MLCEADFALTTLNGLMAGPGTGTERVRPPN
jgi:hypothetical protein